jgi:Glycosyltransferase Family 4
MVSQMTPYLPCHDGFRVLTAHPLENLPRRHTVALITATEPGETPEQRRWAASLCASVDSVPAGRWTRPWTGAPAEGVDALRTAVTRTMERFDPDVLHLEGGPLAPLARLHGVPTVLAPHDSRALRAREFRRLARTPWSWVRAYLDERMETAWEARWYFPASTCSWPMTTRRLQRTSCAC